MSKILQARRAIGMTQGELAVYLGVSQSQISKWEWGESYPNREMETKIKEILPLELQPRSLTIKEINIKLHEMSDEQVEHILKVIKEHPPKIRGNN